MTIVSSLIETVIMGNKININLGDIPNNVFGVFVTVKRSDSEKLNKYPHDIHGCIGYWDEQYKILNNDTIIKKMCEVGKSAFYNDDRRTYFKNDASIDPDTSFEITFMLNSVENGIMKIDNNGNIGNDKYFDNKLYGIIVENNRHRATYLPNVFPNSDWKTIKTNLLTKASISHANVNDTNFFAYNTIIKEGTIGYNVSSNIIKLKVTQFMNKYYTTFIPYSIENNEIKINKLEYVRNIASMYDTLKILPQINSNVMTSIEQNIDYYIDIYNADPINMRQASAFLLLTLKFFSNTKYDYTKEKIHNTLYDHTKRKELEKQFELGEVLMALAITHPIKDILDSNIQYIKKIIESQINIEIFQLNWYMKFIEAYDKSCNIDLAKLIITHVLGIVVDIDVKFETNYLAVAYECLTCSLLYLSKYKVEEHTKSLLDEINRIYRLIIKRYNNQYSLLEFNNGNIRIDITFHFLSGIYYLDEYYKKMTMDYKNKYLKYKHKYMMYNKELIN